MFVKYPYLPSAETYLAVSAVKSAKNTIEPFKTADLPVELQRHADLTICPLGSGKCVTSPESFEYYQKKLREFGVCVICGEKTLKANYPFDCAYNVAVVGQNMFCKIDITDGVLLREAEKMGYKIHSINQGYAKCSVCPIAENAAISADVSFCKAAAKIGIDVLQITNDTILLQGYANGFFGGASFMADEQTLAVNGDIATHPDCDRIIEFLKKYKISLMCVKGGAIVDFGSSCAL